MPKYYCAKYHFNSEHVFQNDLQLELFCYAWHEILKQRGAQVLDKSEHFKNIVNILWGPTNKTAHFVWNPWAERMNEVCHEYKYPALNGGGSSGKSDFAAVWAIVQWLVMPKDTIVLVTTTGLKDANRRIWGAIEKYFIAVNGLPGKLISSQWEIYTVENGAKVPKCGVQLIAGEKKKEKEAMAKLIGAKAKRVFLIADELPELSPGLVETGKSNLTLNPFFQMMGIGNFATRYDPFGEFVEPEDGWDSPDYRADSDGWKTKLGYCVHFDCLKSPNILAGKTLYKGIYDSKMLASHRKDLGENTAGFWRMCRSFEAPVNIDDALYSDADFAAGKVNEIPGVHIPWLDRVAKISAMDPGFTNGGDRTVQKFAWFGQIQGGLWVLCEYKMLLLREDVRIRDKTRSRQICEQFRDNCIKEGVPPRLAALDATGPGGKTLADLLAEVWTDESGQMIGTQVLRVDFSGAVSNSTVGPVGGKLAKDCYDRRVSEIWGVGVEFMRYGQLRGIPESTKREMKARMYDTVKGPEGLKTKVEIKPDMKVRLGFSPDEADTYFILLDLARQRLKFVAGTAGSLYAQSNVTWRERCNKANLVYANADNEVHEEVFDE